MDKKTNEYKWELLGHKNHLDKLKFNKEYYEVLDDIDKLSIKLANLTQEELINKKILLLS
jgi:hypothetical protein